MEVKDHSDADRVKVAVRVRPFTVSEMEKNSKCCVAMNGSQTTVVDPQNQFDKRVFTFDHCYWSHNEADQHFASQSTVFDDLGTLALNNFLAGFNASILAYGQTGAGKSYTMMGREGSFASQEEQGLIPRVCEKIFDFRDEADNNLEVHIEVSYLEIYNEQIRDLLGRGGKAAKNSAPLTIRTSKQRGAYVAGLSQWAVSEYKDVQQLFMKGDKMRSVSSHKMNLVSSRSHAVFTVQMTQTFTDPETQLSTEKKSKIQLVDLAGSERQKKSGVSGKGLTEMLHINKSLHYLGLVIESLSKGKSHVPYRNSVLTWLLQDSLGGNSRAVMIAALSPAHSNFDETLSTLKYADMMKSIRNKAVINEDETSKQIRELMQDRDTLRSQLQDADQDRQKLNLLKSRLNEYVERLHHKFQQAEQQRRVKLNKEWEDKLVSTRKEIEHIHEDTKRELEQAREKAEKAQLDLSTQAEHATMRIKELEVQKQRAVQLAEIKAEEAVQKLAEAQKERERAIAVARKRHKQAEKFLEEARKARAAKKEEKEKREAAIEAAKKASAEAHAKLEELEKEKTLAVQQAEEQAQKLADELQTVKAESEAALAVATEKAELSMKQAKEAAEKLRLLEQERDAALEEAQRKASEASAALEEIQRSQRAKEEAAREAYELSEKMFQQDEKHREEMEQKKAELEAAHAQASREISEAKKKLQLADAQLAQVEKDKQSALEAAEAETQKLREEMSDMKDTTRRLEQARAQLKEQADTAAARVLQLEEHMAVEVRKAKESASAAQQQVADLEHEKEKALALARAKEEEAKKSLEEARRAAEQERQALVEDAAAKLEESRQQLLLLEQQKQEAINAAQERASAAQEKLNEVEMENQVALTDAMRQAKEAQREAQEFAEKLERVEEEKNVALRQAEAKAAEAASALQKIKELEAHNTTEAERAVQLMQEKNQAHKQHQEALAAAEKRLAESRERSQKSIAAAQSRLQEAAKTIADLQTEHAQRLRQTEKEANERVEELEAENRAARARETELKEELEQLTAATAQLQKARDVLAEKAAAAQRKVVETEKKLQRQVDQAQDTVETTQKQLASVVAEKNQAVLEAERRAKDAAQAVKDALEAKAEVKNAQERARAAQELLQRRVTEKEAAIKAAQQRAEQAAKHLEEMKASSERQVADAQSKYKEASERAAAVRQRLTQVEEEKRLAIAEAKKRAEEVAEVRRELEQVKNDKASESKEVKLLEERLENTLNQLEQANTRFDNMARRSLDMFRTHSMANLASSGTEDDLGLPRSSSYEHRWGRASSVGMSHARRLSVKRASMQSLHLLNVSTDSRSRESSPNPRVVANSVARNSNGKVDNLADALSIIAAQQQQITELKAANDALMAQVTQYKADETAWLTAQRHRRAAEQEQVILSPVAQRELAAYAQYFNNALKDVESVQYLLPLRTDNSDLLVKLRDGWLLSCFLNLMHPGIVDTRALNRASPRGITQAAQRDQQPPQSSLAAAGFTEEEVSENLTLVVETCRGIGIYVGDIRPADLRYSHKKPAPVIRFLWRLVSGRLLAPVDVRRCPMLLATWSEMNKDVCKVASCTPCSTFGSEPVTAAAVRSFWNCTHWDPAREKLLQMTHAKRILMWFNFHIRQAKISVRLNQSTVAVQLRAALSASASGHKGHLDNLGTHPLLQNSLAFALLLYRLHELGVLPSDLDITTQIEQLASSAAPLQRARIVVSVLEQLTRESGTSFVAPPTIVSGGPALERLCICLLGSLFANTNSALAYLHPSARPKTPEKGANGQPQPAVVEDLVPLASDEKGTDEDDTYERAFRIWINSMGIKQPQGMAPLLSAKSSPNLMGGLHQSSPNTPKASSSNGSTTPRRKAGRRHSTFYSYAFSRPLVVQNLYADLKDGLVLLRVIDHVAPNTVQWSRVEEFAGGNRFKVINNCNLVIKSMRRLGLKTVNISGSDIADGNKKLILALVWRLMQYHIRRFLSELYEEKFGESVGQSDETIINWANRRVKELTYAQNHLAKKLKRGPFRYPYKNLTSFNDPDLSTSLFFLHLLWCIEPRVVNWDHVARGANDDEKLLNARYAISVARKLGATLFLLPEDIVACRPKLILCFVGAILSVDQALGLIV